MFEVHETPQFHAWRATLRDPLARAHVAKRIQRLRLGNPGDARRLTAKVSELKIDHGPGYRLYFTQRGHTLVLLLCGGDKSTQKDDIKRAIKLAAELGE